MKLKTSLSLMLESILNGDMEGAKNHLSQYMKRKAARIVNEYDYDYDYDHDYDYEHFNGSEEIKEVVELNVDGVKVTAKIHGTQEHAAYEQPATGYYKIYEYGPITLHSLNAMTIAGETVLDGVDLFEGATAKYMLSSVDDYAHDLYESILETHKSVKPLPQNIMTLVTPEFCAKIVTALAKELQSREGDP